VRGLIAGGPSAGRGAVFLIDPLACYNSDRMDISTIVGLAAGTLTTLSFLPQLVKTLKSRTAKDLSVGMYMTLSTGLFFWVIYGVSIHSLPVILTNVVTLVLALIVLALKLRYG
jgi:MtN3 and saliva related transmembrane protein